MAGFIRSWLYAMCRGIEHDPVKPRQLPKTIGCSKNFPGKTALATREQVSRLSFFPCGARTNDHQLPIYETHSASKILMSLPRVEQSGCPTCAAQDSTPFQAGLLGRSLPLSRGLCLVLQKFNKLDGNFML